MPSMRRLPIVVSCVVSFVALLAVAPAIHATTLTSHTEKAFPAKPGGKVLVHVSFHDVEVKVADVEKVTFVVDLEVKASASKAQELLEDYAPRFSERQSAIAMRSARKGGWGFSLFGGHKIKGHVRVTMPPGMNLTLNTASGDCEVYGDLGPARLNIDVASGEVTLRGAADEVLVDAASGDVELILAREVLMVDVNTASGEVLIKGGVRELRADTSSGDVVAYGLLGSANFDTASGKVKARWSAIDDNALVVADTASGDVRLSLPSSTVVAGRLTTSSGGIMSGFPGRSSDRDKTYRLDGGAGAVQVRVGTSSGDIDLIGD